MTYVYLLAVLLLLGCGTSSTEKPRETDSARVDGTRLVDTTRVSEPVPPGITNPQPD